VVVEEEEEEEEEEEDDDYDDPSETKRATYIFSSKGIYRHVSRSLANVYKSSLVY
jgi:hypothetical protein